MQPEGDAPLSIPQTWAIARAGEMRRAVVVARGLLAQPGPQTPPSDRVELHLVCAFCAMRQGDHETAMRDLDDAAADAERDAAAPGLRQRIDIWRAELAYFQGRYTDASRIVDRVLPMLEQAGDASYGAFALRIRIAILLARRDYDGIAAMAERARQLATASGDDYVRIQILNILGAVAFDRASTKLSEPHARAHLSSLHPHDLAPMEADAREALHYFEQARAIAERARFEFAAWYVAGNIERLEILLGHADRAVPAIRKRLRELQARGAKYDEIVTRSNLAWGLRILGRNGEALHELDVALELARDTRTANVLLEFLEYDRSIVLDALGQPAAARASYRRYLELAGACDRRGSPSTGEAAPSGRKQPLEPWFLKRADRFVAEHVGEAFSLVALASYCGVSLRTLEKAFADYRSITPVAHVRNLRLDHAHRALSQSSAPVTEIASRFGFRSSTTFTLEYRKRFGNPPSRARRAR